MATTLFHPKSTVATRTVKTRRVAFDHHDLGTRRHYFDGDLINSHLVAVLSGVIPPGERFFAETVRHHRHRIDEPALSAQANSFVGQEIIHQREHDRFNHALARLGYPTAVIDRASAATFSVMARLPHRTQLAMTAAIEHWTAVIAEHVLTGDWFDERDLPAETRSFLGWHLVEELEHKAVAFDTMQAVGTPDVERIAAMGLVVAFLAPAVVGGLVLSMAGDPATRNLATVLRSIRRLRTSAVVRWSFVRDLLAYERLGFHPDERGIDDLLDRWRDKLFGSGSPLAVRLRDGH